MLPRPRPANGGLECMHEQNYLGGVEWKDLSGCNGGQLVGGSKYYPDQSGGIAYQMALPTSCHLCFCR